MIDSKTAERYQTLADAGHATAAQLIELAAFNNNSILSLSPMVAL